MSSYRLQHLRRALGDRYELEVLLGRGAFATVYRVRNRRLRRHEALKVLSETHEPGSPFAQRFVAEATLVASLDHPNIVQIYDYGEADGILWYAMQFIEGASLRAELAAGGRLDETTALRIFIPLLAALELSHGHGVVHRDIKPANIMLSRAGRPFLTDFGIAKQAEATLTTLTGSILGTPAYMAPEQAEGKELDGRADLYSVGVVLYEALSGRLPFDASEPLHQLLKRLQEAPIPLGQRLPEVRPELAAAVMRALNREREERFGSAAEMRRSLQAVLGSDDGLPAIELKASPVAGAPVDGLPTTEDQLSPHQGDEGGELAGPTRVVSLGSGPAGKPVLLAPARGRGRLAWLAGTVTVAVALGLLAFWPRSAPVATPVAPSSTPADTTLPASGEGGGTPATEGPTTESSSHEDQQTADRASEPAAGATPRPAASPPARRPSRAEPASSALPPAEGPHRAVEPPRLLETAQPALAADLQAVCAGRSAILSLRVAADGAITEVRTLTADEPRCTAAAEAAARRYRFAAARDAAGKPVAATATVRIQFGELNP